MDRRVIKSPTSSQNALDEVFGDENSGVNETSQDPELTKISAIFVDQNNIDRNIDNPDHACQRNNDNVVILQNEDGSLLADGKIDYASENLSKEGVAKEPKNTYSFLSGRTKAKVMTKPLRSFPVCGKNETSKNIQDGKKVARKRTPVKMITRKVLAEKQNKSNAKQTFLRSSGKRGASLPSGESKTEAGINVRIDCNDSVESIDEKLRKTSCGTLEENILGKSGQSLDPLGLGSEKQDTVDIGTNTADSYADLPLMEQILCRKNKILDNMKNQVKNAEPSKNATDNELKKRFHRRKCSEPFKSERVQTRLSRSVTLTQNKNEYKYISRVPKIVKCAPFGADQTSGEKPSPESECTIICTPDININDCSGEISSNYSKKSFDTENNNELLGINENQNPLSLIKNSPGLRMTSTQTKCSKAAKRYHQSSRKLGKENENENLKRKLRHVNAQAMPLYVSTIAVAKNENLKKSLGGEENIQMSRSRKKVDKASDVDRDKAGEREECPVGNEKESEIFFNNICLRSKTNKSTEPKCSSFSNTDSEETLSNVESVPNSPAQETWPKVDGRNSKIANKCAKLNSGLNVSHKRDASCLMNSVSADANFNVTENKQNAQQQSVGFSKRSKTEISNSSKYDTKKDDSEPRYYVQRSANQNPFHINDNSERNIADHNLGGQKETPWLRHFERPHKTHMDSSRNLTEFGVSGSKTTIHRNRNLKNKQEKHVETIKKPSNTLIAISSASKNPVKEYTETNQSKEPPQLLNSQLLRKRGRPRKQATQGSEKNANKRKGSNANYETAGMDERKSGSSASRAVLNGSGLSKMELECLFLKFLQHGHFRIDPEQPTIITPNNNSHQNFTARMQCYNPNEYYMYPQSMERKSNSTSETYPHLLNNFPNSDGGRFYPSNKSSSSQLGHGMRIHKNSCNFSDQLADQTTYSRNLSPSNTYANIPHYIDSGDTAMNRNNFNEMRHTNSAPNYAQSGYGIASNYHQNFYSSNNNNNNANGIGNNSFSHIYSDAVNSNDSVNNMINDPGAANLLNCDNDFNFILNNQNQHQNSMPCGELDLTMSIGNTVSSNSMDSMQTSPANNGNPDWNLSNVNQPLDSVNGLLRDLNSMNHAYVSSPAMERNSDLNNSMRDENLMTNSSNPWMNTSNNMGNPRFPILEPWHASLPMYNSYLNNDSPYYNNMFNPYGTFMGFDLAGYPYESNMNARNDTGINGANPWMRNIFPSVNVISTFDVTNSAFSNMNSGSFQENTMNQGVNLSLSSNTAVNTTLPETNLMEVNDANLEIERGDELNPSIEQMEESTFAQVERDNNNIQQSTRGYSDKICEPYSLDHKTETQDLDFDNLAMVNTDDNNVDDQQQNLPQLQDRVNKIQDHQTLDSIEGYINQNYKPTGSPNCEIIAQLSNNRETEISKLRQELADFTRQFSEDQMSPTSRIPQADEIFTCMMTQNLEAERNPT